MPIVGWKNKICTHIDTKLAEIERGLEAGMNSYNHEESHVFAMGVIKWKNGRTKQAKDLATDEQKEAAKAKRDKIVSHCIILMQQLRTLLDMCVVSSFFTRPFNHPNVFE